MKGQREGKREGGKVFILGILNPLIKLCKIKVEFLVNGFKCVYCSLRIFIRKKTF